MCLNPLDGSSLADARASDSASATNYRFSLLELTLSNDRWISQLHWHRTHRRETAAREHSPAGFPSRVDPKWNYGGQIEQTIRKRDRVVLYAYALRSQSETMARDTNCTNCHESRKAKSTVGHRIVVIRVNSLD